MTTTAIYVDDGCGRTSDGEDVREWWVTPGDDDGEPTGEQHTCSSRDAALKLAAELADGLGGLEVVEM